MDLDPCFEMEGCSYQVHSKKGVQKCEPLPIALSVGTLAITSTDLTGGGRALELLVASTLQSTPRPYMLNSSKPQACGKSDTTDSPRLESHYRCLATKVRTPISYNELQGFESVRPPNAIGLS